MRARGDAPRGGPLGAPRWGPAAGDADAARAVRRGGRWQGRHDRVHRGGGRRAPPRARALLPGGAHVVELRGRGGAGRRLRCVARQDGRAARRRDALLRAPRRRARARVGPRRVPSHRARLPARGGHRAARARGGGGARARAPLRAAPRERGGAPPPQWGVAAQRRAPGPERQQRRVRRPGPRARGHRLRRHEPHRDVQQPRRRARLRLLRSAQAARGPRRGGGATSPAAVPYFPHSSHTSPHLRM